MRDFKIVSILFKQTSLSPMRSQRRTIVNNALLLERYTVISQFPGVDHHHCSPVVGPVLDRVDMQLESGKPGERCICLVL